MKVATQNSFKVGGPGADARAAFTACSLGIE